MIKKVDRQGKGVYSWWEGEGAAGENNLERRNDCLVVVVVRQRRNRGLDTERLTEITKLPEGLETQSMPCHSIPPNKQGKARQGMGEPHHPPQVEVYKPWWVG